MKYVTFSKNKLKNYFLAMTYLLLGFGLSHYFSYDFLLVVLGVYLTTAFLYIRSFTAIRKRGKEHA